MSFAFLPLYTGDYLRDTRHLTPLKHGIYLLLLMHCWDQRGPLPLDEQETAGISNCRSADEIEALRYVLDRYFIRMTDGWYNKRMQVEVERSENISKARSDAGKRGYEAKAKQLLTKSQASDSTPTPTTISTTTPTTKNQKDIAPRKTRGTVFVLPEWLKPHEDVWNAWVEARTKAKHPPTDWAKQLAVRKLEVMKEDGHNPRGLLAEAAFHNWQTFYPKDRV